MSFEEASRTLLQKLTDLYPEVFFAGNNILLSPSEISEVGGDIVF